MLKCSTSLWSADLANLESEIKRVEPFSERFHIDVADGNYVKALLFFPDLVRAVRGHTSLPFEVHFSVMDPLYWVDPFVEAGADSIVFYLDSSDDPKGLIEAIRSRGKQVGISLKLEEPLEMLDPYWEDLDIVTIVCAALGKKGLSMDPSVPDKIRAAKAIVSERGLKTEIQADGGIRRWSVPLMHAAGADSIVVGSLMFGEDPVEMRKWLASL